MVEPGGRNVGPIELLHRTRWEIIERPHPLIGKCRQRRQTSQNQQKSAHEVLVSSSAGRKAIRHSTWPQMTSLARIPLQSASISPEAPEPLELRHQRSALAL